MIGDSFTMGSQDSTKVGFACRAANEIGYLCPRDAQPATGYLADGHRLHNGYERFGDRLTEDRTRFLADVVVVEGGRNDDPDNLSAGVDSYLTALKAAFPKAKILVLGVPWPYDDPKLPAKVGIVTSIIRASAAKAGVAFADPVAERWYQQATISVDRLHPTDVGHQQMADHLAVDLRRL